MTYTKRMLRISLAACMSLFLGLSTGNCEDASDSDQYKHYFADAMLFSMQPDDGLDSYRVHGKGGVSPRGTLGLGAKSGGRDFDVTIVGSKKQGRFSVRVTVEPNRDDSRTESLDQQFDFSELTPQMLELGRDEDGRIYRLNLLPRVQTVAAPRTFRVGDLGLERWTFQDSCIILNDMDYLGRIGLGGSPIAWIDIPGLAVVEFSLLPLTDAAQEGVLVNGNLDIVHDDSHIHITNVLNGTQAKVLPGGPFRVWVRWKEPSQTVEQYRESCKKQLAMIKQRIADGDLELPQKTIDALQRSAESGRILVMSCGGRAARKGDVAETSP